MPETSKLSLLERKFCGCVNMFLTPKEGIVPGRMFLSAKDAIGMTRYTYRHAA